MWGRVGESWSTLVKTNQLQKEQLDVQDMAVLQQVAGFILIGLQNLYYHVMWKLAEFVEVSHEILGIKSDISVNHDGGIV